MARRPRRIDRDNPERWMVSYADFITLLFAFFVVMYSISSVNEGKYQVFSLSLNSVFGQQTDKVETGSVRLTEQEMYFKSLVDRRNARLAEQQRKLDERMKKLLEDLNVALAAFIQDGLVSVSKTSRGVMLDINASALFKPGDAVLQAEAQQMMAGVAALLKDGEPRIEVEGHTDNLPIKSAQFPSNWELSSARASSVVRLFIEQGVEARRLLAVGSADNHPVAGNDTPEGRARNRRVTITVLNELPGQQPAASAPSVVQ